MTVALGVGLPLSRPIDDLVQAALTAERLGYGFVWASDDRLQRDVFSVLAAIGLRTERIALGPGVTNPYSRHPALVASAIATLDEVTHGRAVLGLGAGGTAHGMLGIERRAPAWALREAIGVTRALLAGSEVTVEGRVVRTRGARLDFPARRPDVPIYVGARGPRILQLAGELADGVIVGNLATPDGWSYALGQVSVGAERAGRTPGDLRLVAWLYCALGDDPAAAMDAVRPMVATSLVTSRSILGELGVDMPPRFAVAMQDMGWSLAQDAVTRASEEVPDDVVHQLALAGTPADCRPRLIALLDAFPEIAQVAIVPIPLPGQDLVDVIRRFAEEVAGELEPITWSEPGPRSG
ncbi:MAG: LLM class flavin-dependent oxidoreductase [Actinomycetota bacterium]